MPVFRVERTKNFTVMSNHHLRDKTISLKAKGLLSQMLSLPNDWDYTLRGLAAINKESIDAVRTAIHELETAGYVVRSRVRDERGLLRGCEYFVYEYPHTEDSDVENRDDFSVPPVLETPVSDSTAQENPTQLNKEIPNKSICEVYSPLHPARLRTRAISKGYAKRIPITPYMQAGQQSHRLPPCFLRAISYINH